jgi:hypothetical protein
MFFSNNDFARLLEAFRRREEDDRHRNRRNRFNRVAGLRDLEDIARILDDNFRERINAIIDRDDFRHAIRRRLIRDLVGGLRDDNDDNDNRHHHKRKRRRHD